MGPDAMILVFWTLSFNPTFSLSSFTFIKRLFSSSSLSAIRVVSSAYLRLLIFILAILIPACASSSPAFLIMYSAYRLNKQGDNIQPWRTPFPIWNQPVVPCPVQLSLPDLHTGFSRDRSGGLAFPSLSELSTVCCDSHASPLESYIMRHKDRKQWELHFPSSCYPPTYVTAPRPPWFLPLHGHAAVALWVSVMHCPSKKDKKSLIFLFKMKFFSSLLKFLLLITKGL